MKNSIATKKYIEENFKLFKTRALWIVKDPNPSYDPLWKPFRWTIEHNHLEGGNDYSQRNEKSDFGMYLRKIMCTPGAIPQKEYIDYLRKTDEPAIIRSWVPKKIQSEDEDEQPGRYIFLETDLNMDVYTRQMQTPVETFGIGN